MEEQLAELGLLSDGDPKRPKESKSAPVPVVNIALFVIQACNLRCVYCYGDGGGYGGGGKMAPATARRAVDWLIRGSQSRKDLHIAFFGGEPLLNFPLMCETVRYAEERGKVTKKRFSYSVTTNATLLDEERVAWIKAHKVNVLVSFDGPREIQDAQRPFIDGRGSFEAAVVNIRMLLKELPDSGVRATLLGSTDPDAVRVSLREFGFKKVCVAPVSASLFGSRSGKPVPSAKVSGILRSVEKEAEQWRAAVRGRDTKALGDLAGTGRLVDTITALCHGAKKNYPCGAGRGLVGVSCEGEVFPCHRFIGTERYRLGSVFTDELDRDAFLQYPAQRIAECARCFARNHCAGGCWHENAGACGSCDAPSPDYCAQIRRSLEMAAMVAAAFDEEDLAFLSESKIIPRKPCPFDFP
ncbi:radical SAM protein [Elusimicrobiota bacterium]